MKYDFTTVYDRAGHDSIAVEGLGTGGSAPEPPKEGWDAIPMWIADMSFPTCPTITEAMIKRLQHPLLGYFPTPDAYYNAIIDWQTRRNGVSGLTKDHIGYENGVLGGVVTAMNVLCSKGDHVLVHSPTYVGFTGSLGSNGYKIVHSPLVLDENGVWRMNFADMEEKIVNNRIHAMVFCNPHNPTGRVWERWELEQVAELCRKHEVYIISDEIWSDIILDGYTHIPMQSVSDDARNRTIALYAPSKTFNLAGLVGSYHIIYNQWLKDRMDKQSGLCHYNSMNVLSMHALMAAYKEDGHEWVDELRHVLTENAKYACDYIRTHFDGVTVADPQGTYMLFIDCTEWCRKHGKGLSELLKAGWDVGVGWQDGRRFHGPCHIRMNLSLPMSLLQEALDRLTKYVFVD